MFCSQRPIRVLFAVYAVQFWVTGSRFGSVKVRNFLLLGSCTSLEISGSVLPGSFSGEAVRILGSRTALFPFASFFLVRGIPSQFWVARQFLFWFAHTETVKLLWQSSMFPHCSGVICSPCYVDVDQFLNITQFEFWFYIALFWGEIRLVQFWFCSQNSVTVLCSVPQFLFEYSRFWFVQISVFFFLNYWLVRETD